MATSSHAGNHSGNRAEFLRGAHDSDSADDARELGSEHSASLLGAPFDVVEHGTEDRITPGVAGGLVGFVAGLVAIGFVHGLEPGVLAKSIGATADVRGVSTEISFVVAYITTASIGALLGALFATVTRNLRKWFPLAIWAIVFFVSLAMLALAIVPPAIPALAAPICAASALFGLLMSVSLPIRRMR